LGPWAVLFRFLGGGVTAVSFSYCRSLIAASSNRFSLAEVKDVNGDPEVRFVDDFKRVMQLCSSVRNARRPQTAPAIDAYFSLLNFILRRRIAG